MSCRRWVRPSCVLGTGERRHQELWRALAAKHPDVIGARIGFDEGLAHLIEGGSDIFLMPSRFEPCGLNQMYSLRYGTVPVVRATGGLRDTVRDVDPETGRGHGFHVRGVHAGGADGRASTGARAVWQPARVATHPEDRDASGLFVGRVGSTVRRRLCAGSRPRAQSCRETEVGETTNGIRQGQDVH